jgi:carbon-monoxide dehydrogenase small subunit
VLDLTEAVHGQLPADADWAAAGRLAQGQVEPEPDIHRRPDRACAARGGGEGGMSEFAGAAEERVYDVVLHVNGVLRPATVPARRLLSDCLRHDLRLTGTHVGCEHGVCGACTVLVDGRPMRSCLMLAVSAEGAEITTVEGLGTPEDMHPVQQAFRECHGLQCGFCTPGFLTTIAAFIEDNPEPTEDEAREAISGNLCRCTGYQNIVKATLRAAELSRDGSGEQQ